MVEWPIRLRPSAMMLFSTRGKLDQSVVVFFTKVPQGKIVRVAIDRRSVYTKIK